MKYCSIFLIVLCLSSCASLKKGWKLTKHKYEDPFDTRTKPIQKQKQKIYLLRGVSASNNFPGARLNNFTQLNDSTFQATIQPENFPINPSPWYAFKLWSNQEKTIHLKLNYSKHQHRYSPKFSADGQYWKALDTTLIYVDKSGTNATLKLNITKDTLWIASQEIHDTKRVGRWVDSFRNKEGVTIGTAGKSALGKPLYFIDISKGNPKKKPVIIIISRQHPPEVTGYFAMQSFVETIVKQGSKNGFLARYRLLVYPLLNPDGVDLGHYRHNTGGVDLNRDWSQYHQPEIAQITRHMVAEVASKKNKVVLGLDFHSTYNDVYYTHDKTVKRKIPDFTKKWLERIRLKLNLDRINEQANGTKRPTSSAWFNKQFGATGITYEIGDDTQRDFITLKGKVSAEAMMAYFLE